MTFCHVVVTGVPRISVFVLLVSMLSVALSDASRLGIVLDKSLNTHVARGLRVRQRFSSLSLERRLCTYCILFVENF
jgi:hypothetical protein